jgi:hypothetical protein
VSKALDLDQSLPLRDQARRTLQSLFCAARQPPPAPPCPQVDAAVARLLGQSVHVDDEESRAPIAERLATLEWHLWPAGASAVAGREVSNFPRPSNFYEPRPGDWTCSACGAKVFASKSSCYKCYAPKSSARPHSSA